jgi:16S rRNA (adenine(1408)-N(1))-methyltransferase
VILDIGTGDGRTALARARAEPAAFVVGLDADARSMEESSRRAARRRERGGTPNAMFLAAAVEALPGPFAGTASLVTVTFPWGSLLAGALGLEPAVSAGLACLVRPGGRIEILTSIEPGDRMAGLGRVEALGGLEAGALEAAWAAHGLDLVCRRPATPAEIDALHSSWGRRLTRGGGAGRAVWRLELAAAAEG